ncbi:MAG: hypothetical protein ACK4ZU_02045 [Allorhizobium sp.]
MAQYKLKAGLQTKLGRGKRKRYAAQRSFTAQADVRVAPVCTPTIKKAGPDYNPDYFDILDRLVEDEFGMPSGDVRLVSGTSW